MKLCRLKELNVLGKCDKKCKDCEWLEDPKDIIKSLKYVEGKFRND